MIEGRLSYNCNNDRYGLLVSDLWEYEGFHCGDPLEVKVDDKWIHTRIEMAWDEKGGHWYLVGTPYFDCLEYVCARIKEDKDV